MNLDYAIDLHAAEMIELLSAVVAIPSVSGRERAMSEFVAEYGRRHGFIVDLWQADEDDLVRYGPLPPKFIPLADRPTLVLRLPGAGGGRNLMFNAHSDVVAAADAEGWRFGPWSGRVHEGNLYGRGACDTKGPLVSALWAMRALQSSGAQLAGDVLLELIPGEEDCVGLGTLTSVARGWKCDGVVILEPTEGEPRCASRGGLRFEIASLGKSVHGTVKWLGEDAIAQMPRVLETLKKLESKWNDRQADSLFSHYPFMRPITVDTIHGGEWQGMICDRCVIGGYLELLPGDDLDEWGQKFSKSVLHELSGSGRFEVRIIERYDGHRTEPGNPLCVAAAEAAGTQNWAAFNSGCEAGLRARMHQTPTLVWGPGSLAQAHAVDEFVNLKPLRGVALDFATLCNLYCGNLYCGAKTGCNQMTES